MLDGRPWKKRLKVMFPKGLTIAVLLGVIAGPVFGIILFEYGEEDQLIFVDGDSISIVTEKNDFKIGENISIKIINSGTTDLTFSDASYGLEIKQLDGILVFKPISAQMISLLESHEEFEFVWNQNKNNDEQVLEGLYKVTSNGISENGNTIYGLEENLLFWRKTKNSLSSSTIRKLIDGFLVYYKYLGFNFIKSLYYLLILSINYLKKNS